MKPTKTQLFLETFHTLINELIEDQTLIIVEGKNDKKALKKLGLENIITLSTPLYQIVEIIELHQEKEVVILTDFDKKGRHLYTKIKSDCSQRGIKINNKLRWFLRKETDLIFIEGLHTFIKNKQNI